MLPNREYLSDLNLHPVLPRPSMGPDPRSTWQQPQSGFDKMHLHWRSMSSHIKLTSTYFSIQKWQLILTKIAPHPIPPNILICAHLLRFPLIFAKHVYLKKWANPGLLFVYYQSLQTNITIFTTNLCEKCSSNIRCRDSNPWPLECESLPITTRPGLPPC